MGTNTVVPVAGPGGGMKRVSGGLHVCRLCPSKCDRFIRCSSSNVARTCLGNGKAAAQVRVGGGSPSGISVAVRPAANSFSNFIGSGTARLHVGLSRVPGGVATGINSSGIGLMTTHSVGRCRGNAGICFCSITPGLGGFTAGKDRFRGGAVAGGPRLLMGLTPASVDVGKAIVVVSNCRFSAPSARHISANSLTTPVTRIASKGARTCALGPA